MLFNVFCFNTCCFNVRCFNTCCFNAICCNSYCCNIRCLNYFCNIIVRYVACLINLSLNLLSKLIISIMFCIACFLFNACDLSLDAVIIYHYYHYYKFYYHYLLLSYLLSLVQHYLRTNRIVNYTYRIFNWHVL